MLIHLELRLGHLWLGWSEEACSLKEKKLLLLQINSVRLKDFMGIAFLNLTTSQFIR